MQCKDIIMQQNILLLSLLLSQILHYLHCDDGTELAAAPKAADAAKLPITST